MCLHSGQQDGEHFGARRSLARLTFKCQLCEMKIDQISVSEANAILTGKHYLGPVTYPPRYCFATPARDAIAVFGFPNAASFKVTLNDPVELVRLWRADGAVVRTDHFLHRCLQLLRTLAPECDAVLTYADPAQGHTGKVYKGCGFTFVGKSRTTDQWEMPDGKQLSAAQVYRRLGSKSRTRIAELQPQWKLIAGVPKLLFVFPMRMPVAEVLTRIGTKLPEARRVLFSRAHGGFRAAVYQQRFPAKKCAHCRQLFIAARRDARTCSPSCRTMRSRKKQAMQ